MEPVVLVAIIVLTAGATVIGSTSGERRLILYGFLAHIAGVVGLVLYHERAGGDMILYRDMGAAIAKLVARDPRYFEDVVKLAFHRENGLAIDFFDGTSSGTMCAFMAAVVALVGDNLYAVCVPPAMFSFLGLVSLYRAVAPDLDEVERRPVLLAMLFTPSVVFWTSGFVKEAFVVGFLGLTCRGLAGLRRRILPLGVVLLAFGVTGIVIIKPYTLLPLVLGGSGWLAAGRRSRLAVGYRLLGVAVAIVAVFGLTRAFPEYGVGLSSTLTMHRMNYNLVAAGGSAVEVGPGQDDVFEEEAGLVGQVKYLPLAFVNALARPMLFDVHNVASLLAAFEMTALLVLALLVLKRAGPRRVYREVVERPPLLFAALFVLAFTAGVGLTTRNLGTLSRYRVPEMPLYLGLVVALRARFAPARSASRVGVARVGSRRRTSAPTVRRSTAGGASNPGL